MAQLVKSWDFTDWETMIVALDKDRIVGFASIMKTDYYPLPDIFPWVSSIFVTEDMRGNRISEKLIDYANEYLKAQNFDRSYIPSEFFGLYEKYGYTYVKDILNYGDELDHLFVKTF
ncbi:MAG: GNAT family N-acetyltransferase [Clostridia bacterium]|nr:GNAT family N-acetyltransferase [Clostridia bacterium]